MTVKKLLFAGFCIFGLFVNAQSQYKHVIKGKITDVDSDQPLIGATVILNDSTLQNACVTDINGFFKLEDVPAGRRSIKISYLGYQNRSIDNIIVKPGKETYITASLEEEVLNIGEVVVNGYSGKDRPVNDMALISARSFTVEQTEKFAGSWGDPSRMASNYAGVGQGNDESNDIVIRGNSPSGLIWKLEGIPIPNPNHFDGLGATGGPISMLNNNLLKRSDFYTSAFPAEFGDGISGVFDIKLREGNFEKGEYVAQIGANGFELGAEGPISKKNKSTYMINYRHSMLGLVDELLTAGGLPRYKDLTMKMNFPYKKGKVAVFTLLGTSKITFADTSTFNERRNEWEIHNGSKTAIVGLNQVHFITENLRMVNSVAATTKRPFYTIDSLYGESSRKLYYSQEEIEDQLYIGTKFIAKANAKNKFELGASLSKNYLNYSYDDKELNDAEDSVIVYDPTIVQESNISLFQAYFQWKYKFTNNLVMSTGVNFKNFLYNNTYSIEPRLAFNWLYRPNSSISFGYGNHGQTQPLYVYALKTFADKDSGKENYVQSNKNLEFTKSHHFVLGHDLTINSKLRIKVEAYYQSIYNVPVEQKGSYFSMLNIGESGSSNLDLDSLINEGTGENYGIELTIERFLNNNFYYLLTTSLFNSTYIDGNGVKRNTVFNSNYVVNALGGYEYPINKQSSIKLDIRATFAGGRRILEYDREKTLLYDEPYYLEDEAYSKKAKDYMRFDLKIGYMRYGKKITQEFAIDITNLTNRQNELMPYYSSTQKDFFTIYQQGIFPVALYRLNF